MNFNKKIKDVMQEIGIIIKNINAFTACFTGYRPQKCPWGFNEKDQRCVEMKKKLRCKIIKAIERGYHTFITGMAIGFDMICAEIVLELKKLYPNIKLIGALPCKNQASLWNGEQQKRYNNILKKLDSIRCIYDKYIGIECMHERNQYMINNSSLVIALFNGKAGGTKATLEYAKEQDLEIEIIEP